MINWLGTDEILNPGTQITLSSFTVALWYAFLGKKIPSLSYSEALLTGAPECLEEKPQ